jgi:hypothetical protein
MQQSPVSVQNGGKELASSTPWQLPAVTRQMLRGKVGKNWNFWDFLPEENLGREKKKKEKEGAELSILDFPLMGVTRC